MSTNGTHGIVCHWCANIFFAQYTYILGLFILGTSRRGECPAYFVLCSDILGYILQRENCALCSTERSFQHSTKGSIRLMTRGGNSPQAFMHHVPFTAKHVGEHSHWEFQ